MWTNTLIYSVTSEPDAGFDSHDFSDNASLDVPLCCTMYRDDTTFKRTMPVSISK